MKQLNVITGVGLFPLPLARTKSLPKAKAQAEFITHHGCWVLNVFISPTAIRMIEVIDVEPPTKKETKEASIPVPIEAVPAPPQLHQEDQANAEFRIKFRLLTQSLPWVYGCGRFPSS
jgi:hypothetical protein